MTVRTSDRFTGALKAHALVWVLAAFFTLKMAHVTWAHARSTGPIDFYVFWDAARLVLRGDVWTAYTNHPSLAGSLFSFLYLPPFLLLVTPLGWLNYGAALILWLAITGAAYAATSRRPLWLTLVNPPAAYNVLFGQTGFLTSAIFLGGLSLIDTSPLAAGVVLGLMLLKPQLGILLPIAFIAGGRWRALAAAAVTSLVLLLLGAIGFGTRIYAAWWTSVTNYSEVLREGMFPMNWLSSPYALWRWLGASHGAALLGQLAVTVAAGAMVAWSWREEWNSKVPVLAAATILASPYSSVYDAVLLIAPLGFLAARTWWKAALIWLLLLVPLIDTTFFGHVPLPVDRFPNSLPFAAAASLLFLWQSERAGQSSLRMVSS